VNKILKGYWYEEGYIRTSSKEFTIKNISNKMIHLTNDAIQKKVNLFFFRDLYEIFKYNIK
jgi:hypothetical protein